MFLLPREIVTLKYKKNWNVKNLLNVIVLPNIGSYTIWTLRMLEAGAVLFWRSSFFRPLPFQFPKSSFFHYSPSSHTTLFYHLFASPLLIPIYSFYEMLAEHRCCTQPFALMSCQRVCVLVCVSVCAGEMQWHAVQWCPRFSGKVQCCNTWLTSKSYVWIYVVAHHLEYFIHTKTLSAGWIRTVTDSDVLFGLHEIHH